MCVAIYKPENVQMPSLDTLKKCWEANPDGAGFALCTSGDKYAIEIHKGYMTWKQFKAAFEKYRLADFAGDMLLHFRIATHGGISPGNTHPFSLTGDVKLLKHTNILTNYALIHNGILPIKPEGDISDTMEFCRRLAPLYQNIPSAFNLIEGMAGNNKIAVITRERVHLFGQWECVEGVYFSNLLWDWSWDIEPFLPDKAELALLRKGVCPDCDAEVMRDKNKFYCLGCDAIWTTEVSKCAF
jgi:glutamine amidotransferases class-II